jgi:hypothetical protein
VERNRIELIVVDGALLGRRNRNFLIIAGSCFLENSLEMVFLLTMVSMRPGTDVIGVLVVDNIIQSDQAQRGVPSHIT